jgi:hypothetical protein
MRSKNPGKTAVSAAAKQKYNNSGKEYSAFIAYLRRNTATCTMVCVALNIYRPNGTRFKRRAQRAGILWEVRKGVCAVTGYPAWYLTTSPDHKPKDPQTRLFNGMEGGK